MPDSSPQKAARACVTIGNFDGVHRGHQTLIRLARETAERGGLDFILVSFWPHPRQVLRGEHHPLTSRQERMRLLRGLGADTILEMPFDRSLAALTPEEFVARHLLPLGMRELVVGYDFTLGRGRQGGAQVLADLGSKYGFALTQARPFSLNDEPVSSTRLRQCIAKGRVEEAAAMLGRLHSVGGVVSHGLGRGAGLGFPTANLTEPDALLPGDGVYAAYATADGKRYAAVANIGVKPTFGDGQRTVESFLLDANLDLYDKPIRLEFAKRLRQERKFDSPEELAAQIQADVARAKSVLADPRHG